jgi:hypothetical protein
MDKGCGSKSVMGSGVSRTTYGMLGVGDVVDVGSQSGAYCSYPSACCAYPRLG